MKLLLHDTLAPITSELYFLQSDRDTVTDFLADDLYRSQRERGLEVETQTVNGPLADALKNLLPLQIPDNRRYLLMNAVNGWTAFFDNGSMGTDPTAPRFLCQDLNCRGIRIVASPQTFESSAGHPPGRWGALIFEVYSPDPDLILNYERIVSLSNQGGYWDFHTSGEPFGFEDTEQYTARRKRDRFTFEMLCDYAAHMGLRPFDEDFYMPDGEAMLIEIVGPRDPSFEEFTLEERQARILTVEERAAIASGNYIY